jgi:hypothetical protein
VKRAARARLLVILLATAPAAVADFELLLGDGQLLSGVDVRRVRGEYLLELESGQTLSIPEELVAEVRITAGVARDVRKAEPRQLEGKELDLDDEEAPHTGVRKADPEVLAGDEVNPPRTSEQLEALGDPARFSKGVFNPNWRPESVYDRSNDVSDFNPSTWTDSVIDPNWQPDSDYTWSSDVSDFSPSRFTDSIIEPSWEPRDGFEKTATSLQQDVSRTGSGRLTLTAARVISRPDSALPVSTPAVATASTCTWCPRFTLTTTSKSRTRQTPRKRGTPTADRIRACAEELLEPLLSSPSPTEPAAVESLSVRWIIDEAFARLPIALYEGLLEEPDGTTLRAVFTYSGGECRLIGGDLASLLGADLTEAQAVDHGAKAYNGSLTDRDPVRLEDDREKIDYALAVSSLVIPGSADVRLLSSGEELTNDDEPTCSSSKRSRRKGTRQVNRELTAPRVKTGATADVVIFYSWDRVGGDVRSHRVLLSPSGEVTIESELLATHLGAHACEPAE